MSLVPELSAGTEHAARISQAMKRPAHSLQALLAPETIAIIGASATRGKHGNTVVRYLLRSGYQGAIFPVNPGGRDVEGLRGYASILDTPSPADCAFLAIAAENVLPVLADCARSGVRSAVIGASGFAELGTEEGRGRQREITKLATASGMRVLGPNTNGLLNNAGHVALGYNASHGESHQVGGISIASHSGALLNSVARRLTAFGGGLSHFVTIGNEADVTLLDVFDYLVDDQQTSTIGLVVESLHDVERFKSIAERAAKAGKPIVGLKVGRSNAGAAAAMAHSSRMAGQSRCYEALWGAYGVTIAHTVESFAAILALLDTCRCDSVAQSSGMICVATSGGGGALTVDAASDLNIQLAGDANGEWSAAIRDGIDALGGMGRLRNPLDLSSLGRSWARLTDAFKVFEENGVDGPVVAFAHVASRSEQDARLLQALRDRRTRIPVPVLVLAPGGLLPEIVDGYRAAQIPVHESTATCLESLSAWLRCREHSSLAHEQVATAAWQDTSPLEVSAEAFEQGFLSEIESTAALRAIGIPFPPAFSASSMSEAADCAQNLGFPVVLKAIAHGYAHKSQHGLVALGIGDQAGLGAAFARMEKRALHLSRGRSYQFLVQPQLASDLQIIVGVSRDSDLGLFMLVGLGGIYAEIMDESLLTPIPATASYLQRQISDSRFGAILRQSGSDDLAHKLVGLLMKVQDYARAHADRIDSIDINPLLLVNEAFVAVDALITLRESACNEQRPQDASDVRV